jgi:predicted lipid-binding transport protein (Tim44 family)
MKRYIALFALAFACLALFSNAAEARRFGGGGSLGKQRSIAPQQAPTTPAAQPAKAMDYGSAPAQKSGSKWLGPLAGLALGAGIGTLLAGMGLGQGLGAAVMMLMAGLAVFFIVSMLRSRQQPLTADASAIYPGTDAVAFDTARSENPVAGSQNIPADFPAASFVRSAKTTFIRMQAANDRRDLDDIREYTTPEMFAEIAMQLDERIDAVPQKTDVIEIDCELLEVGNEGNFAVASVRFTGRLRENGGDPEAIDEIWHVQKDSADENSVWLLAGIQQTACHV